MIEPTLKQSGFSSAWKVVLGMTSITWTQSELLSTKKIIPYRQVTGVFRDAEKCYIVWGGEVAHFLHQPKKEEYNSFVAQMVRRVKSARGA